MAGKPVISYEVELALARRLHNLFYRNAPFFEVADRHPHAWVELPSPEQELFRHVARELAGDIIEAAARGR